MQRPRRAPGIMVWKVGDDLYKDKDDAISNAGDSGKTPVRIRVTGARKGIK